MTDKEPTPNRAGSTSTVRFEPLDRRTLPIEIRDRLIGSIESGELKPGQMLPAERTLCAEFNVARTSVREAIQSLVSLGYLERRGNRAYVVERLPGVVVSLDKRKDAVRELFETRRVIEVPIAELATCRASDELRDEIASIAERFQPGMDLDEFRRLDREFHWAIARGCGNPFLAELYGKVLDALFSAEAFSELLYATDNRDEVRIIVDNAAGHHHAIADAIRRGDPVTVVATVEDHLGDVERRMLDRLV
ncbi:MAG TPA: FadR/GntR family transcriptional regulator [Acidimicrobiales bacterium]